MVSSLLNSELLRETDSLVGFVEEIYKCPEPSRSSGHSLIRRITHLVGGDLASAMTKILVRIGELRERLSNLSFGESVELMCALKRLENCSDKLCGAPFDDEGFGSKFWRVVIETKETVAALKMAGEEGRTVATTSRLGISQPNWVTTAPVGPIRPDSGRGDLGPMKWFCSINEGDKKVGRLSR